jgi:hypothetical protein
MVKIGKIVNQLQFKKNCIKNINFINFEQKRKPLLFNFLKQIHQKPFYHKMILQKKKFWGPLSSKI